MRRYAVSTLLLGVTIFLSAGCTTTPVRKVEADPTRIEMVSVKGGCFQMGDTFGDGRDDERPVHEVCLDDFAIGKYEVTQGQWLAVMGSNPSSFKTCGPDCPVENVSAEDVQKYLSQLNKLTGKQYRLPFEAEWEYAARSGGKKERYSGTSDTAKLPEYVWFEDNSEAKTHPVGTKKPNELGIYDMTGNVWEWCQDKHADTYYKNSPGKNPQGPAKGLFLVTRGGSFGAYAWNLRVTNRGTIRRSSHNEGLGFRLVLPKGQ